MGGDPSVWKMSIPFELTSLHIASELGVVYFAWWSLQFTLDYPGREENF